MPRYKNQHTVQNSNNTKQEKINKLKVLTTYLTNSHKGRMEMIAILPNVQRKLIPPLSRYYGKIV